MIYPLGYSLTTGTRMICPNNITTADGEVTHGTARFFFAYLRRWHKLTYVCVRGRGIRGTTMDGLAL